MKLLWVEKASVNVRQILRVIDDGVRHEEMTADQDNDKIKNKTSVIKFLFKIIWDLRGCQQEPFKETAPWGAWVA